MEAAGRVVAERGYAEATIKEIALAAGVTGAALYRYFPSKVDLVASTVRETLGEILPRLAAATDRSAPFPVVFHALLDEALCCVQDHPYITRLQRTLAAQPSEPALVGLVDEVLADQRALVAGLVARFGPAIDPGIADDAVVDALMALTQGLTELSASASPERHAAALEAAALLVEGRLIAD
jgi:AcrR family transcriptional regulator